MNLRKTIDQRMSQALQAVGAADAPALVSPATRPEFGDYQCNACMAAAKKLKTNPRELAGKVIEAADLDDLAEKVEIAGPGFINITLKSAFLESRCAGALADQRLGIRRAEPRQTVVVDYSGPNLAKEMHVGHLRSTIIGDALARTLEFLGCNVIRQNHVGDWGTQFGMLTAYLDELRAAGQASHARDMVLSDLEEFYRQAKQRFDEDPAFAETSRLNVVKLQGGDEDILESWRTFRDLSLRHCDEVYRKLNIALADSDVRGESAYNDDLPTIVSDLDSAGLLSQSQGAQCVFLDEFKGKDGQPLPVIVRKSDGGYLYATTDLAALRYRVNRLHADRILYVTDSRQHLHFQQVFAVARRAAFVSDQHQLEHIGFGMMLGDDGRPFKTREGGTVKLADLVDQAVTRAEDLVAQRSSDVPADKRAVIARAVGVGALKYADLAQNRTSDYIFNWDKMLSLEGNTAPYMQYAYARVRSIFRKAALSETAAVGQISIRDPAERALAVKLAQLAEVLEQVAIDCAPHLLCGYLFELAGAFMGFYENCPVLKADEPIRTSRLMLALLTARTISQGLELLGIETLEQM
jgi:arginyl-tRNA synthetase